MNWARILPAQGRDTKIAELKSLDHKNLNVSFSFSFVARTPRIPEIPKITSPNRFHDFDFQNFMKIFKAKKYYKDIKLIKTTYNINELSFGISINSILLI